jgi:hypothetical protein
MSNPIEPGVNIPPVIVVPARFSTACFNSKADRLRPDFEKSTVCDQSLNLL